MQCKQLDTRYNSFITTFGLCVLPSALRLESSLLLFVFPLVWQQKIHLPARHGTVLLSDVTLSVTNRGQAPYRRSAKRHAHLCGKKKTAICQVAELGSSIQASAVQYSDTY